MSLKKLLMTSSTLLVATLTLSACGNSNSKQATNKPAAKQSFKLVIKSEIATRIQPLFQKNGSANMINNAMEGFFRIKNNHAEPGLATKD